MNKLFFYPVLLFCWILIVSSSCQAQNILSGKVSDSNSGEPIALANIFVANSMLGTQSDESGNFSLDNLPTGSFELVISHLTYETQVIKIRSVKEALNIRLAPGNFNISEISVSGQKQKKWKRLLKRFEKAFFGETDNARLCKILNPEILYFEIDKDKRLIASASDLVQIENLSTGYQLSFYLEKFEQKGLEITYAGKPFFKPIEPANRKQEKQWIKNRKKTYSGSTTHFFRSLLQKDLKSNGFEIYRATLKNQKEFVTHTRLIEKDVLKNTATAASKRLIIPEFIKVVYVNEDDLITDKNKQENISQAYLTNSRLGRPAEKELMLQEGKEVTTNLKSQTSFLFGRKSAISVDTSGYLNQPELLVEFGYWHWERIADLLPREYYPRVSTDVKTDDEDTATENYQTLNDFVLNKLKIPFDEIKKGGPPRDGIPSIDQPHFITAEEVDFLSDDELVLGINIDGTQRAYPIRILNFHEIVNDQFGEQAIALTYCPLCGSGIAFDAQVDGRKLDFGVSGLLYNSDVLLYDRQSESLWSQILSSAVSGHYSGTQLQTIPLTQTTWSDWKQQHPSTQVLSKQTGFDIDYNRKVYEGYELREDLMFPVNQKSDLLSNKEKIIGIEIEGKFKAYPFSAFEKSEGEVIDYFMGKELKIIYDSTSGSARIFNNKGELMKATTMYWFAWYAFHPNTYLYSGS